MSISLDPLAAASALLALWIAYTAHRASNHVWLKILDMEEGGAKRLGENNEQLFLYFQITLRNLGIPLHSMTVHLEFGEGSGNYRIQLTRIGSRTGERKGGIFVADTAEFAKGMTGVFAIKSYALDPTALAWLSALKDPRKQNARITVHTQGFLAQEFPMRERFVSLRRVWNRIAIQLYPRGTMAGDRLLPYLGSEWKLKSFARDIGREPDAP